MRRVQAFVLLSTILFSPILAFAAAIPYSTACCCSGTLCPMHKNHPSRQGPHGKSLCGATEGHSQECKITCCNQYSDNGILQTAPEAVLPFLPGLLLPGNGRISGVTAYAKEPSRFVLPPEQPPRR